jgi:hypothetical protein
MSEEADFQNGLQVTANHTHTWWYNISTLNYRSGAQIGIEPVGGCSRSEDAQNTCNQRDINFSLPFGGWERTVCEPLL